MNDGWGMEHDVDINIANVGFFWFGGFGFWWRWYPFRCLSIRRRDVGCVFWGGVVLLNLYSLCCIIGCNGLYSREGEEGGGGGKRNVMANSWLQYRIWGGLGNLGGG